MGMHCGREPLLALASSVPWAPTRERSLDAVLVEEDLSGQVMAFFGALSSA